MKKKRSSLCQSCSMPLEKDPQGGGTQADGTPSQEYCSYCFKDGQFVEPNLTLPQMRKKLELILKQKNTPWYILLVVYFTLPRLKRWKH